MLDDPHIHDKYISITRKVNWARRVKMQLPSQWSGDYLSTKRLFDPVPTSMVPSLYLCFSSCHGDGMLLALWVVMLMIVKYR